jgi:hypothetical protein
MNGVITYNDASRREDLTDVITNVSPETTPFLSALSRTKAQNTLHEYLTDTYDNAAHNASIEGADAAFVDLTQPARANNITQIFRKVIKVSGTEMAVNQAGMSDPFAYQMKKQSIALAKDMENALIAGTIASGASGVARQLRGAIATITTNKTAHASGTSLTEDIFNNLVGDVVDSTDQEVDTIFVGKRMKQAISKFTAGNTKNVDANDKKLVRPVAVYESDFGVHQVKFNRYVPANAVLALNMSTWKLAQLRPVKYTELDKTGDNKKGMIIGEGTLEGLGQAANFYASGFNA